MTKETEERIARLESALATYIEESQEFRRDLKVWTQQTAEAVKELSNLHMQYYRNETEPVPAPSGDD